MPRFRAQPTKITDPDGVKREYVIIVDAISFNTIDAPFGPVKVGQGYIRCKGKQFLGTYGRSTPVYIGEESDIYYQKMSSFSGYWGYSGVDKHGLHRHLTSKTGTGKLFSLLEKFCEENSILPLE